MNLPLELKGAFLKRPVDANKYSVGTVSVVGGSGHYIHAPVIAGLGARAAGAGLVQLVVPDASRIAAGSLVPEATFTKLTATCVPPKADVTVIGMGLGVSVSTEVIVSRLLSGHSAYGANAVAALCGILAGVAVYGVLVIALGLLRADDMKNIRGGQKLVRLLHLR